MPRFAILCHQPGNNSTRPLHWDLMFECGDALRTFACLVEPHMRQPLQLEALDDHRLAYLDYEGPVSGERGAVTRWDEGEFDFVEEHPERWVLDVRGQHWKGRVRLTAETGQRWKAAFEEPSA